MDFLRRWKWVGIVPVLLVLPLLPHLCRRPSSLPLRLDPRPGEPHAYRMDATQTWHFPGQSGQSKNRLGEVRLEIRLRQSAPDGYDFNSSFVWIERIPPDALYAVGPGFNPPLPVPLQETRRRYNDAADRLTGHPFGVTLSATGKVSAVPGLDEFYLPLLNQVGAPGMRHASPWELRQNLDRMFLYIDPRREVRLGETWTVHRETAPGEPYEAICKLTTLTEKTAHITFRWSRPAPEGDESAQGEIDLDPATRMPIRVKYHEKVNRHSAVRHVDGAPMGDKSPAEIHFTAEPLASR